MLRRIFYYSQFPAALVLPIWLLVGWGVFGGGGWSFLGLLVVCPIVFVALATVATLNHARKAVRSTKELSWADVGILAVWYAAVIGFGFFGQTGPWFAVVGILAALAAFWLSGWELVRETRQRVRATFTAFEQAARPAQLRATAQAPVDGGHMIVVEKTHH